MGACAKDRVCVFWLDFFPQKDNYMSTIKQIYNEHKFMGKQIFMLAKSDLFKTYRGAALGWAWAIIQPAMTLFVFWFAFSIGLRHGKPIAGYSYFSWLLAGFLPWFYMRTLIPGGAGCIRRYKHLVTKMKFPVSIIPTYVNMSAFVVHLMLMFITVVYFTLTGHSPDIYYLQLPLYMLMMFVSFTAWSLFAGMLSCISIDFQNLVKSFSTVVFWMSGIIYDVNDIVNPTIRLILKFNPVTVIATGYRKVFIYKEWFFEDKVEMLCYAVSLIVTIIGALWAYKKLRKEIPDVL